MEVPKMGVDAVGEDVVCGSSLGGVDGAGPASLDQAFVAAAVAIEHVPVVAEVLGCGRRSCVVSAVSAGAGDVIVTHIPYFSLAPHCASRPDVNI